MTDNNDGRRDGDIIIPKWLAGFLATVAAATIIGGTAWLFRMESRVATSETSILYTRESMARIEAKLDRLIEIRRDSSTTR